MQEFNGILFFKVIGSYHLLRQFQLEQQCKEKIHRKKNIQYRGIQRRERERERTFLRGRSRGLLLEIVVQEDSELEWGKFSSIETSRPWQTTKAWKQLQKGIPMENG